MQVVMRSEHTSKALALYRHLYWQVRKLSFPRPVYLRLMNSVVVDDEPGGVVSMVNMLGAYDFNNMSFVKVILGGKGDFLDVGANIGPYSLIASEEAGVRVVSLEPNPSAFAKLSRNIAWNKRSNVTPLNLGASDQTATLAMTNHGASAMNHIVDPTADMRRGDMDQLIEVPVRPLDAICDELNLVPALIKIDVEGHEPAVLRGAPKCIGNALACIVEDGEREAVTGIMQGYGLLGPLYYHHSTRSLKSERQRLAEDSIFVHPDLEARVPSISIAA
jgi:FkbM family methyltransferase